MDNKIQNIVLFSIKGLLVLIGVILSIMVINVGDPSAMGDEEVMQLGVKEAIAQNKAESMTQSELEVWEMEEGMKIKKEREDNMKSKVSGVIDFTMIVIWICVIAVVLAFVYLAVVDTRKALITLAGLVGFGLFLIIIYYSVGDEVPQELVDKEHLKLPEETEQQKWVFLPENWRLASTAWISTGILASIAVIGAIGGWIRKMVI